MDSVIVRDYHPKDCAETACLFFDTVHSVNAVDYSPEQLNAWAPQDRDLEEWNCSFLEHRSLVAVWKDKIVGFADFAEPEYLDRLYVHREFQHQGVATLLCDHLEGSAAVQKLITHASITARSFFEHRGYAVVKEQQVERFGIWMTNFVMEKILDRPDHQNQI